MRNAAAVERTRGLLKRLFHGKWIFAALLLCLAATAQGKSTYGGPYFLVGSIQNDSVYSSVGAGVAAIEAVYQKNCPTCTIYVYYYDSDALQDRTAARVTTQEHTAGTAVWATEYPTTNPEINFGSCNVYSGGNGDVAQDHGAMCQAGNNIQASSTLVADPINASNGNKYEQVLDFKVGDLTFRRFYNSVNYVAPGSLGAHWRHSFDRVLDVGAIDSDGHTSTSARLTRPDGTVETFEQSNGAWVPAVKSNSLDTMVEEHDAGGALTGYRIVMGGPQETERYDVAGHLLSITSLHGDVTTLEYSTAISADAPKLGLLLKVTAPSGRSLGFTYDASGRVKAMMLPDGQSLSYTYDGNANLVNVVYPDGKQATYVYGELAQTANVSQPGKLTGMIDEKGVRFETTKYNRTGWGIATSHAGGADAFSLDYDLGRAWLTSPLGVTTILAFNTSLPLSKISSSSAPCGATCNQPYKSIAYDTNGWPSSYTDFRGTVTTLVHTVAGLETQRVEAKGQAQQRTTDTTWDETRRLPLQRTIKDASGNLVAKSGWAYNDRGQVVAECAQDPSKPDATAYVCSASGTAPDGVRRTVYSYCDTTDTTTCPRLNLPLTEKGPRTDVADVTRYSYYLDTDESGCGSVGGTCHRAGDLFQATDAMGHVQTIVGYDKAGRIARTKDANGVITDLAYTPRGWLSSRTLRANADGTPSVSDAITALTYESTGALHSVTDPDGVTLTYTYDDAHRLTDIADAVGNRVHYTLDASGNRIKEEAFDPQNVSRRSLSRTFNTLGQLVKVTDGLGQVTFDATASGSYDANGNLVSAKDALGTIQKIGYDGLDRVVSSVANANGTDASNSSTMKLALDALDQVKSVTDPDGLVTSYGFDGLSNPVSLTSPDTGAQSSTFDTAGDVLTQSDAKSTMARKAYDALGRMTSVSYTDATLNAAFYYDEVASVTGCASSFPVGRLTRVVENAVTTVYCYDNQGRVTEQRQTQGTATDTTDYVYTKAGRLAAVASPSGLVTEYGRDAAGQVTKVTVTPAKGVATTVISAATYLPFGPVASYTLGNGQTIARSYDANYRFTDIVSPALSLHVARDAVGNIVALGNAAGASPAIETYTYDPLYRLTGVKNASGAIVESYTYSKTGDRLTKTAPGLATGTYGYQSGTHRLTTIGTGSRTYDANGSTTGNASAGTTWGYGYSGRGQMTVLQQAGTTVATYAYDASARRIAKTVGSATTRFAYGPGGLLGEYGGASRDYVWMDDTPVAVVDGTVVAFVHADGLNTPRAVTNTAGAVVWSWAYQGNPFGEQAPTSTSGYVLNLRFAGQYFDIESGLNYNGARYYESATGRFPQPDPSGFNGGVGLYVYGLNNPLFYFDSLGLDPHHYSVTNFICSVTQPGCTPQNVFDRLRRYSAPFSDPSHPIKSGDTETIPWLGPVVHGVDPSNCSITNTTLPGHKLYPGQVTRTVVNDNGMISIITDGTGDGPMSTLNDALAYPLWSTVDGNISAPWVASPPAYTDAPIEAGLHWGN
ncbi:RHS repeat-associated core domain-containing protein [Luteibacter sp. PPL554]